MAGAVRFNSLHLHEEASRIAEAGGHALAAEEAHFEELVGEVAAARERDRRAPPPRSPGSTSAPAQAERAAEGGWCRPEIVPRPLPRHRGRAPSGGRSRAGPRRRALRRQRLPPRPERPAVADRRAQHGRQVDLPAPERADRAAGAGGRLRAGRAAQRSAWSTGCSAASARRTTSRAAARPSWSRWSRPPRSSRRRPSAAS